MAGFGQVLSPAACHPKGILSLSQGCPATKVAVEGFVFGIIRGTFNHVCLSTHTKGSPGFSTGLVVLSSLTESVFQKLSVGILGSCSCQKQELGICLQHKGAMSRVSTKTWGELWARLKRNHHNLGVGSSESGGCCA